MSIPPPAGYAKSHQPLSEPRTSDQNTQCVAETFKAPTAAEDIQERTKLFNRSGVNFSGVTVARRGSSV
ncbi:uncharacterized protein ARMOST_13435 [Armillaria ostoyae]|uniref:Uncharacterized protein n=1 Tax=Armillaria ostoyae TaxID=47428 RepID=A0A284RMQ4_ARMOS|nr:uncharacterized protein ARMOST_13435 [Armillaria ostoyae]